MERAHADVLVLGLGAMGAATCSALARRGVRVLGIEQHALDAAAPFRWGSSGGQTRLVRQAYFEHSDYVPLLREAFDLWRALESRTGASLLVPTGLLYLGAPQGPLLQGVSASARRHGIPVENLPREALRSRWPAFAMPDGWRAVFEPGAGYVLCEAAIDAMLDEARRHGAVLVDETTVQGWVADGHGVRVDTDRGPFRAERLVVSAGPWAPRLLHDLRIPLVVTRQILGWVERAPPGSTIPCWAAEFVDGDFVGLHYGMPEVAPGTAGPRGLKCGYHHAGRPTEAALRPAAPSAAELEPLRAGLRRYLPGADAPIATAHPCFYTMSPDGHFVLGPHPDQPRVLVAAGFSGHGFKFAPVVGEILADHCIDGATARPAGFLAPSRFAK